MGRGTPAAERSKETVVSAETRLTMYRHPAWPGIEAVRASGPAGAIVRHVHGRLVVGLCLAGGRRLVSGEGAWLAGPGQLFVIPSGTPHACAPVRASGQAYLALALDAAWLVSRPVAPAWEPLRVVEDREAAGVLVRLARAVQDGGLGVPDLVAELACRLEVRRPPARTVHPAAARVRDCIDAAPACALSLADLARTVGVSPWHLERLFSRELGLPLGEYRLDRRVRLAVERLRAGDGLTEAALTAGFCDQSHLTRQFRRRVGVPPGCCRVG
jgi:AraC-like DNA-binding protein